MIKAKRCSLAFNEYRIFLCIAQLISCETELRIHKNTKALQQVQGLLIYKIILKIDIIPDQPDQFNISKIVGNAYTF